MLIDVPSQREFEEAALAFLNLAWNTVVELEWTIDEAELPLWDDGEARDEFWRGAQRPLAMALALSQQGIELLLKGHIAATSPFLLIAGDPRGWPRGCDTSDARFADFRTIDSQDLLRAFNAVSPARLPNEFRELYERLRVQRNSIMHSVGGTRGIESRNVFVAVLEASHALVRPTSWFELRRADLESGPIAIVHSTDFVHERMIMEAMIVKDRLRNADVRRYLNARKRQRWYLCPGCLEGCDNIDQSDKYAPFLAQLAPNTSESTNVHCFLCGSDFSVVRRECSSHNCRGNVISEEFEQCLTCGRY